MKKRESKVKKIAKPSKKKAAKAEATGGSLKRKKPAKKPAKKPVAKMEKEIKKKTKTKKIKKTKVKKLLKKPVIKKAEAKKPAKKIKEKAKKITPKKKIAEIPEIEKVSKKEPRKIAMPKKRVARIPQRTIKKIEEKAEISEKTYPLVISKKGLPVEYGEDRITLMTVDPWKLFAYWEVREDTLSKVKGTLALRVYDVTGIYFDGKNANIVFDIPAYKRVGDSYIGVGPGRDFIVDIGAVSRKGDFIAIARSNKVTTPAIKAAKEEGVLPEEIYGPGPAVGYF